MSKRKPRKLFSWIKIFIVFAFCSAAWSFFAAGSVSDVVYIFTNCFEGIQNPIQYLHDGFASIGISVESLLIMVFFIFVLIVYDCISIKEDFVNWISKKNKGIQWIFYLFIGLIIVFFSKKGVAAEFIYFQF